MTAQNASPTMQARVDESHAAGYLTSCARLSLGYAGKLLADIDPEQFGHMPHPTMNHPAFCIGHLSMYPNRILTYMDRTELVIEKPGYAELFDAPVACVEQDGRYPGKDELVDWFMQRHEVVLNALQDLPDTALAQNVQTPYGEKLPTLGAIANFMLNNHIMLHLGQISAWRRAMGMKPAM